jgi:hypothetical protein
MGRDYSCAVPLGSLVVSVLGPKVRGFRPSQGRRIFKGDTIRSTTSFGGEVKQSAPRRKILYHVKDPYKYEKRYLLRRQNSRPFLAKFLLLLYWVSMLVIAIQLWWMNQE